MFMPLCLTDGYEWNSSAQMQWLVARWLTATLMVFKPTPCTLFTYWYALISYAGMIINL